MLDAKGNKIGVPIKASALNCKPTLKNLEIQFQRGSWLKQHEKDRLINLIDTFFRGTNRHTRTNFCDYMTSKGINALFRESKKGRVLDSRSLTIKVEPCSTEVTLEKAIVAQALIKQFAVNKYH